MLVPRTCVPKVKKPWRPSDGIALVKGLSARGSPVSEDDEEWETLLWARKRTGVSLTDMIAAIRDDRLPVGLRAGVSGFHGIIVPKRKVEELIPFPVQVKAV